MSFKLFFEQKIFEGEGLEGFDLPYRYPLKPGRVFKCVTFPSSYQFKTPIRKWYIETKENSSNNWAIYRAAAAQLKRNGVPQSKITSHIYSFLRNFPPTVKPIKNTEIPQDETNVIVLRS